MTEAPSQNHEDYPSGGIPMRRRGRELATLGWEGLNPAEQADLRKLARIALNLHLKSFDNKGVFLTQGNDWQAVSISLKMNQTSELLRKLFGLTPFHSYRFLEMAVEAEFKENSNPMKGVTQADLDNFLMNN